MTQNPWWHDGGESQGDDAAAEAARLFGAIRDRVLADPAAMRAGLRFMEIATQFTGSGTAAAGDAPECAYCPVCQAIRHARSVNPETVERLTAAALEFAESVRQTMSDEPTPDPPVRHVPLDDETGADTALDDETGADADLDGDDVGGQATGPSDFTGWPTDTSRD